MKDLLATKKLYALLLAIAIFCIPAGLMAGPGAKALEKAEHFFAEGDYLGCITYVFSQADHKVDACDAAALIGKSLFELGFPGDAAAYLERARSCDSGPEGASVAWYLARSRQFAMDYAGALELYTDLANMGWGDPDALRERQEACRRGERLAAAKPAGTIGNAGPAVNTAFTDYGLVPVPGDLGYAYVSRKPRRSNGLLFADGRPWYDEDLLLEDSYLVQGSPEAWNGDGRLSKAFCTRRNDAVLHFSADGRKVWYYKDRKQGDLSYMEKKGERWARGRRMGQGINSRYRETALHVARDGKMLVFTSDRPGGAGGLDLYYAMRLNDGSWSRPENFGKVVNTDRDEEAPWLSPDGQSLYFSSKGHDGIGGYDVFRTDRLPGGGWSEPVHLGMPVNSSGDDCFFRLLDGDGAYTVSSDRPGGFGKMDIYVGDLSPDAAKGVLADAQDERNAPAGGFAAQERLTGPPDPETGGEWNRAGRKVFHYAHRATLTPAGWEPVLKPWFSLMARRPDLRIRITGHADERGGSELNNRVAYERAIQVADLFYNRGIAPDRVDVRAFGDRKKVRETASADDRRLNRRVEIVLLTQSGDDSRSVTSR